jgi:ABC-type transport system involved in cytochrome bd biosynthesis fused ATPase/permease subunit
LIIWELLTAPATAFAITYAWLAHNLGEPFAAFARDFQFAFICTVAVIFIFASMIIMLRQAKKLPKSYTVEIVDVYGQPVSIDGVRQAFKTYDAAESYARMYRQNFAQYKFRVVGSQNLNT